MSAWLIELAFGPVQGFIASARRSRDLWAGSHLLSEVARAAGQSLLDSGAKLVYPVESRVRDERVGQGSNLSNVLLARLPEGSAEDAERVARAASEAGRMRLAEAAHVAWKDWTDAGVELRRPLWDSQVADAIESYAAWSREDGDDYRSAYDRVKGALAARKNTRDFRPAPALGLQPGERGIPKSSLDGLKESVLPPKRARFPARLGLSPGEQLDALGCVKRVLGGQERFTALTRMAAEGWLAVLPGEDQARLNAAYEPLVALGWATRATGNSGCYGTPPADFPYDGGLLYPERLGHALQQAKHDGDENSVSAMDSLAGILRELYRAHGQPCPYAALVVADGDRMGVFIDRAQSADAHTRISAAVASFADDVPLIARKHRGHSVFNGGEDLTVLFPLAGVIPGGRALAASFADHMSKIVAELLTPAEREGNAPTLRVGAAICHVLEPLGQIRQWGEAAEKFAKGEAGTLRQGNALGLSLHVRAGHEVCSRLRFDDHAAFEAMERWQAAYAAGEIPGGLAYDIRGVHRSGNLHGLPVEVSAIEFRRVLDRANTRGGDGLLSDSTRRALRERLDALVVQDPRSALELLADELVLARWLSARTSRDVGRMDA